VKAKPVIVIAGPTASGKSSLALDGASRLGGEIVNADSQQVYSRFDIGTAKPSAEELSRVPHHLVSEVHPMQRFSAGDYQRRADAAIADIQGRGRVAFVVGGTGLYLRALLRGLSPLPPADAGVRAALEQQAQEEGLAALHRRLAQVDAESASRIPNTDSVRIVRALEIYQLTGTAASEHRRRHAFAEQRHPHQWFVLSPPREALHRAIDARAARMFEAGLVDEVRQLVEEGFRQAQAMKGVGYPQALAVLDGRMTVPEAIADTALKTRQYAKRQMTWFRREPGARFIEPPYREVLALFTSPR
jgi:tRNA dimethylallyltransferase